MPLNIFSAAVTSGALKPMLWSEPPTAPLKPPDAPPASAASQIEFPLAAAPTAPVAAPLIAPVAVSLRNVFPVPVTSLGTKSAIWPVTYAVAALVPRDFKTSPKSPPLPAV